jgi:hypothetical protein
MIYLITYNIFTYHQYLSFVSLNFQAYLIARFSKKAISIFIKINLYKCLKIFFLKQMKLEFV